MAVQILLRGWVTSVHFNFASAFCKTCPVLTPMNNIVPQVVIELTYFWFRWEYSDDIPLTYKAGHDISRTLWQRRLLTLTFFLLPPSFVAHKYGDSANARRDQGRERVMVRLRLNILHAKYDHRQWREEGERAATLLSATPLSRNDTVSRGNNCRLHFG